MFNSDKALTYQNFQPLFGILIRAVEMEALEIEQDLKLLDQRKTMNHRSQLNEVLETVSFTSLEIYRAEQIKKGDELNVNDIIKSIKKSAKTIIDKINSWNKDVNLNMIKSIKPFPQKKGQSSEVFPGQPTRRWKCLPRVCLALFLSKDHRWFQSIILESINNPGKHNQKCALKNWVNLLGLTVDRAQKTGNQYHCLTEKIKLYQEV